MSEFVKLLGMDGKDGVVAGNENRDMAEAPELVGTCCDDELEV